MDQSKMFRHLIGTVTPADSLRSTFVCSHTPLHLSGSPAPGLECRAERSSADWRDALGDPVWIWGQQQIIYYFTEALIDLNGLACKRLPAAGPHECAYWDGMCLGWDLIRIIWYPGHCVSVLNVMPRYSADGRLIALAKGLETSTVSIHTAGLVWFGFKLCFK